MSNNFYRPQGFQLLPDVTKNLLIINGIFYLASLTLQNVYDINIADYLGLHYWGGTMFRPFQFITYMFLHGSFQHILFNMFALWMFGYAIENYWGAKKFLTYYLLCGIGAAVTHYSIFYFQITPSLNQFDAFLINPTEPALQNLLDFYTTSGVSPEEIFKLNNFIEDYNLLFNESPEKALKMAVPYVELMKENFLNAPVVIGASGGVFGILLAFGMTFPNSLIYIYFLIPIKAKYFVIIYGLIELYAGVSSQGSSNVAHFAHLGGMIFGLALILYWRKKPPRSFNYE